LFVLLQFIAETKWICPCRFLALMDQRTQGKLLYWNEKFRWRNKSKGKSG